MSRHQLSFRFATTLCLVIGLPVAYFVAFKVQEKWRTALLALIIIPSFTSFLIRTLAWRIPLSPNGTLSKWLQDWGVIGGPIQLLEKPWREQQWLSANVCQLAF